MTFPECFLVEEEENSNYAKKHTALCFFNVVAGFAENDKSELKTNFVRENVIWSLEGLLGPR